MAQPPRYGSKTSEAALVGCGDDGYGGSVRAGKELHEIRGSGLGYMVAVVAIGYLFLRTREVAR